MPIVRTVLLAALGFFVFVLNPAACGDGFQYGEDELRAAIEGTWRVAIQPPTGDPSTFTIRIEQATSPVQASAGGGTLVRAASACTSRTFIRGAGACLSKSDMPLQGQVVEGADNLKAASVKGSLQVHSLVFTQGDLSLAVGPHSIHAVVSNAGEASSVRTKAPGETVSLTRIAR